MATSRSGDAADSWTASVSLYSGRPDPGWSLPGPVGGQLEALWGSMEPLGAPPPEPPPLGYRGCFATGPHGDRWVAYHGAVTRGLESRSDPGRAFERFIVESAPAGALPADVWRVMDLPEVGE